MRASRGRTGAHRPVDREHVDAVAVRELTGEELETGDLFARHGGNLRMAFWEMYDQ